MPEAATGGVLQKKLLLKLSQYPLEIFVLESLFQKVAGLKACIFIKKKPQYRCFPVNIAKFLRLPISKIICDRLLWTVFNGSLSHGSKGSRFKLYDVVRIQDPSHRPSFFVFKSASFVLNRVPISVWKPKKNTFDKSIKFLNCLFLVVVDGFRLFEVVFRSF